MEISLLIYHAVNIFTDVKWRVTKNLWHLLFFLGGVMLSVQSLRGEGIKEILIFCTLSVILWLCIGVFLEVAVGMYSPGDTKMTVVSALWLASSAGIEGYKESLAIFGIGISASLLVVGMIDMTRRYGIKCLTEELKSKLFFWISLGINPFHIFDELRYLRKRIRQEQENPSMKTQNIPAAIPIAAGTFFALILM